jgi:hypothetical protein
MRIHSAELLEKHDEVRAQVQAEYAGESHTLWFSLPLPEGQALLTERLDGFVVGLLLKAMQLGEDIEADGEMSARLVYNLNHYVVPILAEQLPKFKRIRITARHCSAEPIKEGANGVITGFSAGVDSFGVIYDHLREDLPPGYRLTHLLFHNVGSHGDFGGEEARWLFNQRYELNKGFPQEMGLPFLKLDSNLSELLQMSFEQTNPIRSLASVLMLQKLVRRYYLASSFRNADVYIAPTYDIAFANPALVHLLSTESLDCVASGSQYTRVEKTRFIAEMPAARRWLNVCTTVAAEGSNCGRCTKCLRVMFTLEMLGLQASFSDRFDWQLWQQQRNRYISGWVLQPNQLPLTREMQEYARASGYRLSLWQRFMAVVLWATPRPIHKLFASLRRRLFERVR